MIGLPWMRLAPMAWVAVLLGAPALGRASAPPVYVRVLTANVAFVAFLPVAEARDQFDVDLRIEVVLPRGCGDRVFGLMRAAGEPERYDVIVERKPVGACHKDAKRLAARLPFRIALGDGMSKHIVVGERALVVSRHGAVLTVDGNAAEGDEPGAPPTDLPSLLVLGEVKEATLRALNPLSDGAWEAVIMLVARWPACAGEPLGLLGQGSAASRFMLDHFEPLARAQVGPRCAARPSERKARLATTLRVPPGATAHAILIGSKRLALPLRPVTAAAPSASLRGSGAAPGSAPDQRKGTR